MLTNGLLTDSGHVREDSAWIQKGPNSADFEQKAWAIAHDFEDGGFSYVPEMAPTPWNVAYMLVTNGFLTVFRLVRKDSV